MKIQTLFLQMMPTPNTLAVLGIFTSLTLAGCTDESPVPIEIDYSIPSTVNPEALENYAYSFPLKIEANGAWNIQFDYIKGNQICYVVPDHGTGNTEATVYVYDNGTEQRRENILYIVDTKTDEVIKELTLIQKSVSDNPENEISQMVEGARRLGIGYGYNTLGQYADANSVAQNPIIDYNYVNEDSILSTSGVLVTFESDTYTGTTASELSNKLSSSINLGVSYCGFKGEVGASFNMSSYKSNETEYAISYVDVAQQVLTLETVAANIIANLMTDKAYKDLNGLDIQGRRKKVPTDYPSTTEGIKKLVKAYGTHLITRARVGGRLKYVTSIDVSKIEGEYELEAFANSSYKNSFVKVKAEVSDSLKQSYKANSSHCKTTLFVQGGDAKKAMDITMNGGDNDNTIKAWVNTLANEKNQTIVGLLEDGLIPLWELIDTELPNGVKRQQMIKDYILGTEIENDYTGVGMNYVSGATVSLDKIPDFTGSTLIKDIYNGSQWVARICEEFIPILDRNSRVKVIYPVLNNRTKYNMGIFLGDSNHKPAKVCWAKGRLAVLELTDASYGQTKKVYIRGKNISLTQDAASEDVFRGSVKDYYMKGVLYTSPNDYPVVKIFNRIWTRQNYSSDLLRTGEKISQQHWWEPYSSFYCYHWDDASNPNLAPAGWRVAGDDDYNSIGNTITANGYTMIGTLLAPGAVTGFETKTGYFLRDSKGKWHQTGDGTEAVLFTNTLHLCKIQPISGGFSVYDSNNYHWGHFCPVRVVQDAE